MASSSLATGFCSFCSCPKQQQKNKREFYKKLIKFPQIASSQNFNFKDEGKRADMVDANMSTLRKRMEETRKKETILSNNDNNINNNCCKNGWNYDRRYYDHHKYKIADLLFGLLRMVASAGGAVGFVFLSGSLCIFIVYFLLRLSNNITN